MSEGKQGNRKRGEWVRVDGPNNETRHLAAIDTPPATETQAAAAIMRSRGH